MRDDDEPVVADDDASSRAAFDTSGAARSGRPVSHHLAQVNAAVLRFPLDDPRLAGFLTAVDRIHLLAEGAPGFVWRHPDAHRRLHPPDGPEDDEDAVTVVNLSVWRSYQDMHDFTYRSLHGQLVLRRERWFAPPSGPTTALWWIREGHRPDPAAALARLRHLRRHGPTPRAFGVRRRFDPSGRPVPRPRGRHTGGP